MSWDDWKEWGNKLKWHFISFKFLSFYTLVVLLVLCWLSLENLYYKTIEVSKGLFSGGFIDKSSVADIIKHSQTVLFDSALGHISVAASVILSAIIAAKAVSYYTKSKQTTEVVKKMENGQVKENLSRFLPKSNRDD